MLQVSSTLLSAWASSSQAHTGKCACSKSSPEQRNTAQHGVAGKCWSARRIDHFSISSVGFESKNQGKRALRPSNSSSSSLSQRHAGTKGVKLTEPLLLSSALVLSSSHQRLRSCWQICTGSTMLLSVSSTTQVMYDTSNENDNGIAVDWGVFYKTA